MAKPNLRPLVLLVYTLQCVSLFRSEIASAPLRQQQETESQNEEDLESEAISRSLRERLFSAKEDKEKTREIVREHVSYDHGQIRVLISFATDDRRRRKAEAPPPSCPPSCLA